ncbi:MAG TPA: YciI family protein [Rugosimonospora sp.]
MKYMLLIHSAATTEPAEGAEPESESFFQDWQNYDKAVKEAGIWVSGHSLADLTTATTVRVDATGDRIITDGPFAETREVLGGYYVIDVPDLDVALDWAARCPGSRNGGSVVVRPVAEFDV